LRNRENYDTLLVKGVLKMNVYVCFWNGKRVEVKSDTTYQAQKLAVAEFQKGAGRKVVKGYQVVVALAEKNGEQVVHIADF
jgi:hypothetical protein